MEELKNTMESIATCKRIYQQRKNSPVATEEEIRMWADHLVFMRGFHTGVALQKWLNGHITQEEYQLIKQLEDSDEILL